MGQAVSRVIAPSGHRVIGIRPEMEHFPDMALKSSEKEQPQATKQPEKTPVLPPKRTIPEPTPADRAAVLIKVDKHRNLEILLSANSFRDKEHFVQVLINVRELLNWFGVQNWKEKVRMSEWKPLSNFDLKKEIDSVRDQFAQEMPSRKKKANRSLAKVSLVVKVNLRFQQIKNTWEIKPHPLSFSIHIGDKTISWDESSLVFPRVPEKSSHPPLSLDLGVFSLDGIKLENLCILVKEWNVSQKYSIKQRNSQHFAQEALKALGFSQIFHPTGHFGRYLIRVENGNFDKSIQLDKLNETFCLGNKKYTLKVKENFFQLTIEDIEDTTNSNRKGNIQRKKVISGCLEYNPSVVPSSSSSSSVAALSHSSTSCVSTPVSSPALARNYHSGLAKQTPVNPSPPASPRNAQEDPNFSIRSFTIRDKQNKVSIFLCRKIGFENSVFEVYIDRLQRFQRLHPIGSAVIDPSLVNQNNDFSAAPNSLLPFHRKYLMKRKMTVFTKHKRLDSFVWKTATSFTRLAYPVDPEDSKPQDQVAAEQIEVPKPIEDQEEGDDQDESSKTKKTLRDQGEGKMMAKVTIDPLLVCETKEVELWTLFKIFDFSFCSEHFKIQEKLKILNPSSSSTSSSSSSPASSSEPVCEDIPSKPGPEDLQKLLEITKPSHRQSDSKGIDSKSPKHRSTRKKTQGCPFSISGSFM